MTVFFTIVHVLLCAFLIVAVLLQSGKGGGLSASVGGGLSSSSVLGGRAATTFL
ncbi:MAG: preprotein translocase subunit SecG, partial [Gemmatimonadetes bacterium]|nr:preprotein translocase subunit SecG [Gemmatimonadota bacterium]